MAQLASKAALNWYDFESLVFVSLLSKHMSSAKSRSVKTTGGVLLDLFGVMVKPSSSSIPSVDFDTGHEIKKQIILLESSRVWNITEVSWGRLYSLVIHLS